MSTSWDDGHPCDCRLAELLAKRSLPATFYVPLANEEGRPLIDIQNLRDLHNQGFEIGAHTMSHRLLSCLSSEDLFQEVLGSKVILEQELGDELHMFCYPLGRYNKRVLDCVEQSGFKGARTTRMLAVGLKFGRFKIPTSLQAFPHPPLSYLRNLGRHGDILGLTRFATEYMHCNSWVELGKRLFLRVMKEGGIWHLYGHSWELEEFGLWDQLEEMLDYVSNRPGIIYASNSGVLDLLGALTSAVAKAA